MSTGWLLLSALLLIATIFLFSVVVRKLLNVAQPKFFSRTYVNETHEKTDSLIHNIGFILVVIGSTVNLWRGIENHLWYFEPTFILMLTFLATALFKVFMEYKYSDNSNTYKSSLAEIIFSVFALFYWYNQIYRT